MKISLLATAFVLTTSTLLACASTSEDVTAPSDESALSTVAFPKVGTKYIVTLDVQPGVANILRANANGTYQFTESLTDETPTNCMGTYASVAKGTVFVGTVDCGADVGQFSQTLELPSGTRSLCTAVPVTVRSSLFGLQNAVPGKLQEDCGGGSDAGAD